MQACVPPEAPQRPTLPEPELTNGTNMIVVLRCFRGNVVLTVARFSLVFGVPGRQRGEKWSVVEEADE